MPKTRSHTDTKSAFTVRLANGEIGKIPSKYVPPTNQGRGNFTYTIRSANFPQFSQAWKLLQEADEICNDDSCKYCLSSKCDWFSANNNNYYNSGSHTPNSKPQETLHIPQQLSPKPTTKSSHSNKGHLSTIHTLSHNHRPHQIKGHVDALVRSRSIG